MPTADETFDRVSRVVCWILGVLGVVIVAYVVWYGWAHPPVVAPFPG